MSNAIAYVRYSPRPPNDDGSECKSNEHQVERLIEYCRFTRLDVVATIQDAEESGGTPISERPGGAELLRLLQAKKAQHIVVTKLDRLSRDTPDVLNLARKWARRGWKLHLADQGGCSIDCSTATGEVFLTMLAMMATWERKTIGERTSNGMKRRQANGERMSHIIPYGYCLNAGGYGLKLDAGEQAIIANMRDCHGRGMSYRNIAESNECMQIPCRGGRWHHSTVKRILERDREQQRK